MYKISKQSSYEIKGIAILLMIFHHFLTFPKWILYGNYDRNYDLLLILNSPTKLCVCIFAFITGWAFFFNKEKNIKNILKKCFQFYKKYWFCAIPILIFSKIVADISVDLIISELLGISDVIMKFCWYVPFYCISIILLSVSYKLYNKSLICSLFYGIIGPIVIFSIGEKIIVNPQLVSIITKLKHWYPCISIGYICNYYNVLEYIKRFIDKFKSIWIFFWGIAICFVGRYYVSAFDFIYCVILIFCFNELYERIKSEYFHKVLYELGNKSTYMWFIHCIFFSNILCKYFQPIIYHYNSSIVVFILSIVILYIASSIVMLLENKIAKCVERK